MTKSKASRGRRRRTAAAARCVTRRFWLIKVLADARRVARGPSALIAMYPVTPYVFFRMPGQVSGVSLSAEL